MAHGSQIIASKYESIIECLLYIGPEVIDLIFYACQPDLESPGMLLEDVQSKDCLTIIDQLVGESNGNIDDLFDAADTNGDGIVIRSEVSKAFQSLSLLRSGGPSAPPPCKSKSYPMGLGTIYWCNNSPSCCGCSGCSCDKSC